MSNKNGSKHKKTWFERAIFISWYCAIRDCKFCFMSTLKAEPKKARRRSEGLYAEALFSKACGWKIEFISGGLECYPVENVAKLTKNIYKITGQKQWLNIGPLNNEQLSEFGDCLEGVCGSIETVNLDLRKDICPSKPLAPVEKMLDNAKNLGLKTAMTIIIGLGETFDDFPLLVDFVERHNIDRITFYALNPHEGTIFKKGPDPEYYAEWIRITREKFPDLDIIAGSWVNRLDELSSLLLAGANAFTKFPSIKLFNSSFAKKIEEQVKLANMEFVGTLTKLPTEKKLKELLEPVDIENKDKILEYAFKLLARAKKSGSTK